MFIFFFNDTATTEIYTLSLHDALPIFVGAGHLGDDVASGVVVVGDAEGRAATARRRVLGRLHDHSSLLDGLEDRKSTRLNSSHANISYAVFCLKKKKKTSYTTCRKCII